MGFVHIPSIVRKDIYKSTNSRYMGKCPHCPNCGKKKSCGNHHVYAIELKKDVLDDPTFCPTRPNNAGPLSRCFYVGETKHRVDCRFNQHRAKKRRRKKEGATFDCTCETGKVVELEFNAYNSPSKYPNKFRVKSRALITEDWIVSRNPVYGGKEASKIAEEELTKWLLSQGHYAHSN